MQTIQASYRITTPMFCSGADPLRAELRLSSFKGALRFWWRSMMWSKVQNPKTLKEREAELFGASDQSVGQSKVRLRMVSHELKPQIDKDKIFESGKLTGAHYLGYGVMEAFVSKGKGKKAGQLTRPMIPGGKFTIECRLSSRLSQSQRQEIQTALILLGTVGGLGSKSRKGFGSLVLTNLYLNGSEQAIVPDPQDRLKALIPTLGKGLPEWTAWSKASRTVMLKANTSSLQLLNSIGNKLLEFRAWTGPNASRFQDDHDLMHHFLGKNEKPTRPPKRAVLGLPHNYFFSSLSNPGAGLYVKAEVIPEIKSGGEAYSRRGSPLFIHICDNGSGSTALITLLASRFLPGDTKITIRDTSSDRSRKRKRNKPVNVAVPTDGFWKPIHEFLDCLISNNDKKNIQTKEVPFV